MKTLIKRTLFYLMFVQIMCSGAFAQTTYVWKDFTGDQDFLNMDNWNAPGGTLAALDTLWIHESGVGTPQPTLTNDTFFTMETIYVGFSDPAGSGRVDLGAGGKMRAKTIYMGWAAPNTSGATSVISLNDSTSLLHGVLEGSQIHVGKGGIDAHLIVNDGQISAWDINVGQDTGTGQVDLLGGKSWLSGTLNVGTNGNVDIEAGELLLIGDQIALVDSLIADGRLTGYGVDFSLSVSTNTPGLLDWTVVTATPIPPLTIGDVTLDILPGTNDLTLTWTSIAGYDYTVVNKISLDDESWATNTTGIAGTDGDITVTTAVNQAQSFYRIIGE